MENGKYVLLDEDNGNRVALWKQILTKNQAEDQNWVKNRVENRDGIENRYFQKGITTTLEHFSNHAALTYLETVFAIKKYLISRKYLISKEFRSFFSAL